MARPIKVCAVLQALREAEGDTLAIRHYNVFSYRTLFPWCYGRVSNLIKFCPIKNPLFIAGVAILQYEKTKCQIFGADKNMEIITIFWIVYGGHDQNRTGA